MFCVSEYARTQSKNNIQRTCVRRFAIKVPIVMQTWTRQKRVSKSKVVCAGKHESGIPPVCEQMDERVREIILRRPKNSVRARMEIKIPTKTS